MTKEQFKETEFYKMVKKRIEEYNNNLKNKEEQF